MNILYLANSFDPHTALWVKYFTKNHNVVLFSDKKEEINRLIYPENIIIFEENGYLSSFINKYNISWQQLRHFDMLISVKKYIYSIENIINKYNIEIIHAHSLYYGFLASFISKNVPVIFTPMGSDIIIYAQKSRIHRFMAKKAFLRAEVVTGDSKILQLKGYQVGAKKENNFIIQNGVDTELFHPRLSSVKNQLKVDDNTFLLFSPRAIAKIYNIDEIIQALKILKDKKIQVKCMFSFSFGNEHYKDLLKLVEKLNLVEEVIWLGYIDYNNMPNYYNAADIVISVPSSDSSPKSVYEAMFCAKPVIVSDLPWSYEFLTDNSDFVRTEVHNIQLLANNIEKLIYNPVLRESIGQKAFKKANRFYSYEKNMIQMESLMIRLVDKFKGGHNANKKI